MLKMMVKDAPDPEAAISRCCSRGWLVLRINGSFRVVRAEFVAPRDPRNPKDRAALVHYGFRSTMCPACFTPVETLMMTPWEFGKDQNLDRYLRQVAREVTAEGGEKADMENGAGAAEAAAKTE